MNDRMFVVESVWIIHMHWHRRRLVILLLRRHVLAFILLDGHAIRQGLRVDELHA